MPSTETFDVAIIGGGPAGASAARLLAQWGHTVVVTGLLTLLLESNADSRSVGDVLRLLAV